MTQSILIKTINRTVLILCFILLFKLSFSQSEKSEIQISIPKFLGSDKELLNKISEQENIVFTYSNKVSLNFNVSYQKKKILLTEFLDELLKGKSIEYKVNGKKVLLIPKQKSSALTSIKGQKKHTISGYVKDEASGEELIGATIYVQEIQQGAATNVYGFYSLTVPEGDYTIQYSYIGFEPNNLTISLHKSQTRNIELSENSLELEEVVIKAKKKDYNLKTTEIGAFQISPKEISAIPVLFGEQDLLKTIQLLPGIKSAGEGSSGFNVRGGSVDQNLVLLDEAIVYNASHLLGFFSVFNSDAIKDVKMIKGGGPAEYGGRLSSVLDIKMNEGNMRNFNVSGGLGLISSRLTLQGPIVKDRGSFIISGRRTYIDVFFPLFSDESAKDSKLYFYDLNMKANYKINDKNRIYISGYFGSRDTYVYAVDASNGKLKWKQKFGGSWMPSSTAVSENKVFVGSSDAKKYFSMNIETGQIIDSIPTHSFTFSSPAVSGNTIIIGVFNGYMLAFDKNRGNSKWIFKTDVSKSITDKYLTPNGKIKEEVYKGLSFKEYSDGEVLIDRLFSLGAIVSSPVIDNGTIYFSTANGYLYAIN